MVQSTPSSSTLTIGELQAGYPLYCKALRMLIREAKSMDQIKRSVCWHRLTTLHACMPRQYKDPEHLYFHLRREVNQ